MRHEVKDPDLKDPLVDVNLLGRPNVSKLLQGSCRGEGVLKTEYVRPEVLDHFKGHQRTNQTVENSSKKRCTNEEEEHQCGTGGSICNQQ